MKSLKNRVLSDEANNEQLRPTAVTGSPKFIPILFSTPMVQAVLDGRKTQTRRVIKKQPDLKRHRQIKRAVILDGKSRETWIYDDGVSLRQDSVKCPYGQPGDVLWVRETFVSYNVPVKHPKVDEIEYEYKADETPVKFRWKPGIHMPKAACRIFLKVKSVRVERLQDISETDAIDEGIEREPGLPFVVRWKDYLNTDEELEFPESSFSTLWKSINGSESWDANPWVWVIEFERIERPSGFQ